MGLLAQYCVGSVACLILPPSILELYSFKDFPLRLPNVIKSSVSRIDKNIQIDFYHTYIFLNNKAGIDF